MSYALFLARRYLDVRSRGRAAQVTTLAAIIGIACGVAAFIIASALAAGFREEMQDKILRGTAHVTVAFAGGANATAGDAAAVLRVINSVPGVSAASRTTYHGALLVGETANAYAVVRGVDAQSARAIDELRSTLVTGRITKEFTEERAADMTGGEAPAGETASAATPVIVGAELAARTGLRVGSAAQIVIAEQALQSSAPAASSSAAASLLKLPRLHMARVVGIFSARLHDYDATWLYAPLTDSIAMRRADSSGAAPTVISVETRDAYEANEVAAALRERLGTGWTVVPWQEANGALFAALELERRTVGVIISLVTIIAGLNILTTLALLVHERRRHIAVLSALGARARGVMAIFVIEGAVIGFIGAILGTTLGLALCYLGTRYEFVRLPGEIYSISSVPFRPRLVDVMAAFGGAVVVSLVASLYPARTAARVPPVVTLRKEN